MLIYLDMCCLKRPFDDQSQPRIRLESEAVLALLAAESADIQLARSASMRLENSRNPVRERASCVSEWLGRAAAPAEDLKSLEARTQELMQIGLKNFDALHVATAEQLSANVFATCDDQLLAAASRNHGRIRVRVASILQVAQEVLK